MYIKLMSVCVVNGVMCDHNVLSLQFNSSNNNNKKSQLFAISVSSQQPLQ